MFMNLSPGAVGIKGLSLTQLIALAKRHGFEGLDLPMDEVLAMPDASAAHHMMREANLRWGGAGLPVEFRKDQATFDADLARLKTKLPAVQKAGVTVMLTWIMPGNNDLDYNANFAQHVARLKPVTALLEAHGVRLAIEMVGHRTLRDQFRHPFVHNFDQAIALADAIGHGTGQLLDSFHWYTSGATADDIGNKMTGGRVLYVHVNDARPGRTPQQQLDKERALPGDTGVIDLGAFVGCLRKVGYDGPVAAEPFLAELGELPADEAASRVAASIKRFLKPG